MINWYTKFVFYGKVLLFMSYVFLFVLLAFCKIDLIFEMDKYQLFHALYVMFLQFADVFSMLCNHLTFRYSAKSIFGVVFHDVGRNDE